jgi:hypothetical protein
MKAMREKSDLVGVFPFLRGDCVGAENGIRIFLAIFQKPRYNKE